MKKVAVSLSVGTKNLDPQVEAIIKQLRELNVEPLVLLATHKVLDPIGTQMAKETSTKYPEVHTAYASEGSFTRAYLTGMEKALDMRADYIISMDADGSHSPEELEKFVKELEKYDVVLSSRNIKGAKNDYPIQRKIISWVGTFFANYILGMRKIQILTDFTSGFEGMRAEVVNKILTNYRADKWRSTEYAYHLQNTVLRMCILLAGYKVKEIPIHYGKHRVGKTLGFSYLWNALRGFLTLIYEKKEIKKAFE